jgi:hypothetical protein
LSTRNTEFTNRDPRHPDDTLASETPTTPNRSAPAGATATSGSSQASQVADQVKQSASDVTEQAKQTATSQIATRKDQAAQGLNAVSSSMRQMGDTLHQNEQTSGYAQYVHQAAEQVDRFSGYLQNRDPRQIMADAENWARRNPALVLGGAFALGLLASRFLKSGMGGQSQASRSWQSGQSGQYRYTHRPYSNDPYHDRYNDRSR